MWFCLPGESLVSISGMIRGSTKLMGRYETCLHTLYHTVSLCAESILCIICIKCFCCNRGILSSSSKKTYGSQIPGKKSSLIGPGEDDCKYILISPTNHDLHILQAHFHSSAITANTQQNPTRFHYGYKRVMHYMRSDQYSKRILIIL